MELGLGNTLIGKSLKRDDSYERMHITPSKMKKKKKEHRRKEIRRMQIQKMEEQLAEERQRREDLHSEIQSILQSTSQKLPREVFDHMYK